jgi:hypothetical protein
MLHVDDWKQFIDLFVGELENVNDSWVLQRFGFYA